MRKYDKRRPNDRKEESEKLKMCVNKWQERKSAIIILIINYCIVSANIKQRVNMKWRSQLRSDWVKNGQINLINLFYWKRNNENLMSSSLEGNQQAAARSASARRSIMSQSFGDEIILFPIKGTKKFHLIYLTRFGF